MAAQDTIALMILSPSGHIQAARYRRRRRCCAKNGNAAIPQLQLARMCPQGLRRPRDTQASPWSRMPSQALAAHARRFYRQAARPPGEVELQIQQLPRSARQQLCAHAEQAAAETAMQRARGLPLQPVNRIGVAVALADRLAEEPTAPVAVVAMAA